MVLCLFVAQRVCVCVREGVEWSVAQAGIAAPPLPGYPPIAPTDAHAGTQKSPLPTQTHSPVLLRATPPA